MTAFDHHSTEFAEHWREIYAEARRSCPVIHSELYGGYDVLTRYDDVQQAFRDYKTFASQRPVDEDGFELEGGVGIPGHPFRIGFLEMDPPESIALRRLVNPWFNPKTIAAGRPRIQEIVTWSVDRVIEAGACDLMADLASPLQCVVILDLYGIQLDRWKAFKEVVDKEVMQDEDSLEGIQWILAELYDEVVAQKAHGGEGLVASLAAAEVDGKPIEGELVAELILMLLLGGMDTTIATMGHALCHLDEHREDRKRLIDNPDLIPGAVDEVLRYYSPATAMARTVLSPVTMSGHAFKPLDRVLLAIASANFDDAAFDDASSFDLARNPNPHLTFGTGTHRCIGADLARTNTEIFLREVLQRMPEYEIDWSGVEPHHTIPHARGFFRVPIRFPRGERVRTGDDSFPVFAAPRIVPV